MARGVQRTWLLVHGIDEMVFISQRDEGNDSKS
jgi:hypothetical protein